MYIWCICITVCICICIWQICDHIETEDGLQSCTVHYVYMALAKHTSVFCEAMLLFVEPSRSVGNRVSIVPRRVCGHFLSHVEQLVFGKRQLGSALMGSLQISCFF